MKAIADVECGSVSQEIGDPESSRQDEVKAAGLFRDLPGEIGPKGASGEFGKGPDPVQCGEGVFDFRGEAKAVRENRFLELDIDHLGADRDLPPIPTVAEGVAQRHHQGRHEGRTLLLGCVVLCEPMGEHVAGGESDFLCPHSDLGRGVGGVNRGGQGSHERDQKYKDEQFPNLSAKSTSVSCRLSGGET